MNDVRLRLIQFVFLVLFYIIFFAAIATGAHFIIIISSIFGFGLNLLITAFHYKIFN